MGRLYPKADVREEKEKKKKIRRKDTGKRNTGLIYDASWITIKRYFTFLGDTPPSNWPLWRGDIKTSREMKIIIGADRNPIWIERKKGERKGWLIEDCLSVRS